MPLETPFAAHLDVLRPHIPERLISQDAFRRIRELAAGIPGALAFSTFGFECPLGEARADADFLLSLKKANSGPDILSGRLPEHDFDEGLRAIPEWSRLRSFGRNWARPPSSLYKGIDDVWLEFDISRKSRRSQKVPSLFMAPFMGLSDPYQMTMDKGDPLQLLENVFSWVRGRKPAVAAVNNWKNCMSMLPLPRHLFQMGIMVPRSDSDTLRLCLLARDPEVIRRYLSHIRWPGDFAEVAPLLKKLSTLFEMFYVHVDAGPDISHKIGIECKFPGRRGPSREPRWHEFLDMLTKGGLCHGDKREGVLEFPGSQRTDVAQCPQPLKQVLENNYPLYESYFVRTLYHVKLVFHENRFCEAKAYLGIDHLWKKISGEILEGRGKWGIIG